MAEITNTATPIRMGNPIATAAIGAASGIGSSIASIINTNKGIKANKAMAEYQYNKDLEMWNRQNMYNSPAQQMQRFKDANLNPNLIYGQGNSGNATTLPKYQAPKLDYNYQAPQIGLNALSAYQDTQLKQAQSDNLRQQTERNEQLTTNAALDAAYKALNNEATKIRLNFLYPQLGQRLRAGEAQIQNLQAGTRLKGYQGDTQKVIAQNQQAIIDAKIAIARKQIEKMTADTSLSYGKLGLLDYQKRESIARTAKTWGETSLIPARMRSLNANIALLNAGARLKGVQAQTAPYQNIPIWMGNIRESLRNRINEIVNKFK